MNFLVVGKRKETRALVRILRKSDQRSAIHLRDSASALAALDQSGACFDFVLVEEGERASGLGELTRAIRSRNHRLPIAVLSYAEQTAEQHKLVAIYEKSPHGRKVLNCLLSGALTFEDFRHPTAADLGEIVLDYQLPAERKQ